MVKSRVSCLFLLLSIFTLKFANAKVLKVPDDYSSIQEAVNAALQGDSVLVANGLYQGNGNRDIDFSGKNLVVLSENGSDSSTIDCGGSTLEPHRAFYFHSKEDSSSIIKGFTIQNGYGPLDSTDRFWSQGGAILCSDSSSPKIMDCKFLSNHAEKYGGAISTYKSRPTIENCSFHSNTCDYGGGAIYLSYWQSPEFVDLPLIINECTFDSNSSPSGGAVWGWAAYVVITDCEFNSNQALVGGAVRQCSLVENCRFVGNFASANGGAVIQCSVVENCTFVGNSASASGGAAHSVSRVTKCTFIGNSASESGGAMFGAARIDSSMIEDSQALLGGGVFRVSNMTASKMQNNTAKIGGAIYGASNVTDCQFLKNSADSGGAVYDVKYLLGCNFRENQAHIGGGLYNADSVKFCIFRDNQATFGGAIAFKNKFSSFLRYNSLVENSAVFGSAISCENSYPFIQYCTIAFNNVGHAAHRMDDISVIRIRCSDVYGNTGGDFMGPIAGQGNQNNNFSLDPLFCPDSIGEYAISSNSPCAPLNNACNQNIGGLSMIAPCSTCCVGIKGDANNDARFFPNILDLNFFVNFIFRDGPSPDCEDESDINGDGLTADLLDLSYIVDFIFRKGPNSSPCLFLTVK